MWVDTDFKRMGVTKTFNNKIKGDREYQDPLKSAQNMYFIGK